MRLEKETEPVFARHETFHPRYGWFRKAYATVADDPAAFGHESAPVDIGVGKNMVRSIRFWGLAAKLIIEDSECPNRRSPDLLPTRFGHALFGPTGFDPYMEDPGTLWLLHWMLLAPPCHLPVWWYAFNEFHPLEFDASDLETAFASHLEAATSWSMPHRSSIAKDVSALFRTYSRGEIKQRSGIDDMLDCPLRELNLIGRSEATQHLRFATGVKQSLPSPILLYAVLDFLDRTGATGNTVMLSRLESEAGSPARAFKLAERELVTALEPAVEGQRGLEFSSPNGAPQLAWDGELAAHAVAALNAYYDNDISPDCVGSVGNLRLDDSAAAVIGLKRDDVGKMQTAARQSVKSQRAS